MAGAVIRPEPGTWDDSGTNFLTNLTGVLRQHFVDPILGTDDQWALAQSKAQAGDDSMLRAMMQSPMAGWVTPQARDEPLPGTPTHQQWFHNQVMNQTMALAGSGVIAGEGALGAADVPVFKWYTGADNMKRFEIPDYPSKMNMGEINKFIGERDKLSPDTHVAGQLDEFVDHPELFKHYPDARKLPVYIAPTVGDHAMGPLDGGQYQHPTEGFPDGYIMLNPQQPTMDANGKFVKDSSGNVQVHPATEMELHQSLMHEVNHYLQNVNGFSHGSSPEGVDKQLRWAQGQITKKIVDLAQENPQHPDIPKLQQEYDNIHILRTFDPHKLYSSVAGEVESGNVEDRLRIGKELQAAGYDNRAINSALGLPTKTETVPKNQQLVFPPPQRAGQIKLQPVEHTPETAPMPQLIPVDHDPFAEPK